MDEDLPVARSQDTDERQPREEMLGAQAALKRDSRLRGLSSLDSVVRLPCAMGARERYGPKHERSTAQQKPL